MVNQITGAVIGLALITLGVRLEGGQFSQFINLSALLITLGGALGATIMATSLTGPVHAFIHAFTGKAQENPEASYRFFNRLGHNLYYCGAIGFVFGCVHVFSYMGTWEQIGAGLGVALLSPLYALVLRTFVTRPLAARTWYRKNQNREQNNERHLKVA